MKPAVEATFRTPPRRRATMPGSTRPVSSTSEVMFSWIIARSAASSRSTAKRPWPPTPALFTSTSISRWPSAVNTVMTALGQREIDVLANNAGVGGEGRFAVERQLAADLAMIQLNITSLVELTGRVLPGMVARRRGGVLNVASTAGFMPGPLQAVYYASKAFVRSFSEAL